MNQIQRRQTVTDLNKQIRSHYDEIQRLREAILSLQKDCKHESLPDVTYTVTTNPSSSTVASMPVRGLKINYSTTSSCRTCYVCGATF